MFLWIIFVTFYTSYMVYFIYRRLFLITFIPPVPSVVLISPPSCISSRVLLVPSKPCMLIVALLKSCFLSLFLFMYIAWAVQFSWKWYNRHTYQVSSLYVLPLESLRSEEINLKKSAWDYLLLFTNMYWMNTLCLQSFVHIAPTICDRTRENQA